MSEFETIAEDLRRQRKELAESQEQTSTRKSETAALLEKIEKWRERSEQTQRRFQGETAELRDTSGK